MSFERMPINIQYQQCAKSCKSLEVVTITKLTNHPTLKKMIEIRKLAIKLSRFSILIANVLEQEGLKMNLSKMV
ncbi:hypothetical protein DOS78_00275 [Staphylococcus felis]|nr:hypothetical protein DOS65_06305 [Staphylococcus felis]REI26719.1 hypothetical protein DOS78_00275 [Staphylococcus felis]